MPEIVFTVPGVPVAWARARRCGNRYFNAPKMVAFENELKYHFLKAVGSLFNPLDCPLKISVAAIFPMPKSVKKSVREQRSRYKTTKPDLDNIVKCLDGLNGVAWIDDAQICIINASKQESIGDSLLLIKIEWDENETVKAFELAGEKF